MWGAIGFLYGLSEYPNSAGYKLNDSMITGLVHPQYTSQKAPCGAQHPDGDALNVGVQARRTGMRGVGIYCQDIYSNWPYQNNGIADYLSRLDAIAHNVVADPNRSIYHYFIFKEPDLQWYSSSGSLFTKMCNDWLSCFHKIKSIDPTAKIAGPGFASYNSTAYRNFFSFCKSNNCMPDIVVWHELQNSFFGGWYNNFNDFRSIESVSASAGTKSSSMNMPGPRGTWLSRETWFNSSRASRTARCMPVWPSGTESATWMTWWRTTILPRMCPAAVSISRTGPGISTSGTAR